MLLSLMTILKNKFLIKNIVGFGPMHFIVTMKILFINIIFFTNIIVYILKYISNISFKSV